MADDKPQPIPRKTPKKRSGPSMREQILARRRAEEAAGAAAPAAKAAPKAAPKPAAKAPAKAPAKAAARPAAKAATGAAAAPKAERAARPTSRTGARRAGAGRAAKGDDDEEEDAGEGRRSRRQRPEPKKKSALPMIAAAVVAIGGVGGYFAFTSGKVDASEKESPEGTDTAKADGDAAAEGGADGSADGATTPEGDGADTAAAGEGDGAAPDAAAAEDKPEPKPKKAGLVGKTTEELVAMVTALEPFPKPSDISDEKWAEMNSDADLVFEGGGAESGRAEKRLGEDGNKYAWPLMINRMMAIDYTDEYQVQSGMAAQRVMQMARGSKNLGGMGWMTAAETNEGEFNDKAHRKDLMIVIKAHESWTTATEDPEWWPKKLYKGEMYKEAEALRANSVEGELEGLDDIDDLDLDDIDLDDDGE